MKNNLTIKEQKFVAEYVENGGNGTKAALKAYDVTSESSAAVLANNTLKKPNVAEALKEEMERQGITFEKIISPVAKGLTAVDEEGKDNISVQLAAHDRAVKLLKIFEEKDAKNTASISFNINNANFGGEFVQNGED